MSWYQGRPESEREDYRSQLAGAHYQAEEWAEARELYEALFKEQPSNITHLGRLGVIAARQGRTADAQEITIQLAEPETDHDVERTVNRLRFIKKILIEKGVDPKIKVRTIDWIPSCSLYIFGTQEKNNRSYGWMQVEIYPPNYRTYSGNRPIFSLNNQEDYSWFEYFKKQFDKLWDLGKEIEI